MREEWTAVRSLPTLDLCSKQCGAKCCRAPLVLQVTDTELSAMLAVRPDVAARGASDQFIDLTTGQMAERTVFTFADEPGGRCPFLDAATNACTVYDVRPESCRSFPDRPEAWCLAWAEE